MVAATTAGPSAGGQISLRRGLPRTENGQPWPPFDSVTGPAPTGAPAGPVTAADDATSAAAPPVAEPGDARPSPAQPAPTPPAPAPAAPTQAAPQGPTEREAPAASVQATTPQAAPAPAAAPQVAPTQQAAPPQEATPTQPTPAQPTTGTRAGLAASGTAGEAETKATTGTRPGTTTSGTASPAKATAPKTDGPAKKAPKPDARRFGRFTLFGWAWRGLLGLVALALVAAILVLASWGLLTIDAVADFVQRYPGAAPQPDSTPIGIPWWLSWQHAFNLFLMVLIIRTGLRVRREQRPPAYFTSKRGGPKVSIFRWLHTGLDLFWVLNGALFIVLLFSTGQWKRIVPTSWDVFPNALSAGLQYVTLHWPLDNPWVHYNALQQLTYFVVVFIAAPVAVISGARMSTLGERIGWLRRAVPVNVARKLHFPTMIFFVVFIVLHVLLVLITGVRRNLAAMFAARGDVDAGVYATSWVGFWYLVLVLAVIVAAWFAVRPLVLAPIARLFGKVSSR